jgi:hypothetical protein
MKILLELTASDGIGRSSSHFSKIRAFGEILQAITRPAYDHPMNW